MNTRLGCGANLDADLGEGARGRLHDVVLRFRQALHSEETESHKL